MDVKILVGAAAVGAVSILGVAVPRDAAPPALARPPRGTAVAPAPAPAPPVCGPRLASACPLPLDGTGGWEPATWGMPSTLVP